MSFFSGGDDAALIILFASGVVLVPSVAAFVGLNGAAELVATSRSKAADRSIFWGASKDVIGRKRGDLLAK